MRSVQQVDQRMDRWLAEMTDRILFGCALFLEVGKAG